MSERWKTWLECLKRGMLVRRQIQAVQDRYKHAHESSLAEIAFGPLNSPPLSGCNKSQGEGKPRPPKDGLSVPRIHFQNWQYSQTPFKAYPTLGIARIRKSFHRCRTLLKIINL